jgi:HEAT repeat protein
MPRKESPRKTTPKTSTSSRYTSANNKLIPANVKPVDVKPADVKPANVRPQPTPVANASSVDRTAIAAHVAALRNNDADFARDAALALGALADAAAVDPLIQAIRNSDGFYHSVVRAAAATSLAKIGDPRALESLIAAVRDSVAEPSVEAIRALGVLADARAIPTLMEVVRNPDGYFLPVARRAAVTALGSFNADPLVADELKALSNNSAEDSVIRQSAVDALSRPAAKPRTPQSR